jgi:ketosteroid isomerase-like protein
MSRENVELVRRAYEVFDTDLRRLLPMLDPTIEWVSPHDALEPGPRHGHQGVEDAFAATAMAWDRPTHTLEGLVEANERVLATVRFRGHGHGSGMDADRPEFHVWTIRDGVVVRFEWFYQLAEALGVAGLSASR